MHIEPTQRRRRQIIGLTPLIDVVFILLVFFMLASSFVDWQSVSLGIPGDGQASATDSDTLIVRVLEDGGLTVDGNPLELDALERRFSEVFAADPERPVVVRPEADVTLQRVVNVVERLTDAGGRRITLNRESR